MKVTIIGMRRGDNVRVHKDGCRDISRDIQISNADYSLEVSSKQEAAEDYWSDFIDEESMTKEEAFDYCHFLPCTDELPEQKLENEQ